MNVSVQNQFQLLLTQFNFKNYCENKKHIQRSSEYVFPRNTYQQRGTIIVSIIINAVPSSVKEISVTETNAKS